MSVRGLRALLMTVRDLWREAGGFAKTGLVVAAVSLALNVASYFGLRARGPFQALHALHWVVILLGVALVFVIAYAKVRAVRRRWTTGIAEPPAAPLPRVLIAAAAGGGLYLIALLGYGGLVIGEGGPDLREGREVWVHAGRVVRELRPGERLAMERFELRIFSASWFFGALLIALIGHSALSRGRSGRAAGHGAVLQRGVDADE
jgi:hypothetical protein